MIFGLLNNCCLRISYYFVNWMNIFLWNQELNWMNLVANVINMFKSSKALFLNNLHLRCRELYVFLLLRKPSKDWLDNMFPRHHARLWQRKSWLTTVHGHENNKIKKVYTRTHIFWTLDFLVNKHMMRTYAHSRLESNVSMSCATILIDRYNHAWLED